MEGFITASWSAVIGAGVVVALELFLKPSFSRKRSATVLLAELRINRNILQKLGAAREENASAVPEDVSFSRLGWDAVVQEVHHLPRWMLRRLLVYYEKLSGIQNLAQTYSRRVDVILRLGTMTPELFHRTQEADRYARMFGVVVEDAIGTCNRLESDLERVIAEGPPDLADSG